MLVAAMNPCPCGYFQDPFHECSCPPHKVHSYLSKISGPLLDRIDMQVGVLPVAFSDLEKVNSTDSATIRKRVEVARKLQLMRYKGQNIFYNSQLTPAMVNKYCNLGKAEKLLMKEAFEKLKLSARAHNKILKVARTIADLDQSENIKEIHLAEALQFRNLDKYFQYLKV
jgi:magnesium chelatase family protein